MNLWDRIAVRSASRWINGLAAALASGLDNPAILPALQRHVYAVRAELERDAAIRAGLVPAPETVVLACYAEELHQEAVAAGWRAPFTRSAWLPTDGVSLRLLACCVIHNGLY